MTRRLKKIRFSNCRSHTDEYDCRMGIFQREHIFFIFIFIVFLCVALSVVELNVCEECEPAGSVVLL